MKLRNKTIWRTDDMKKILSKVAKQEIYDTKKRKAITCEVRYGRHSSNMVSGYAYIHGTFMVLKVQKFGLDKYDFAHVAAHEMAHLEGMKHSKMRGHFRNEGRSSVKVLERYPWLKDMEIRKQEPQKRTTSIKEERYQKALTNLKRAETRFKRAKTILQKWQQKVRYYERQELPKAAEQSLKEINHETEKN